MDRDLLQAQTQAEYAVPVLVGPTGVGKTDLSLQLAESLNAEIISADSRQIYRELNIGAAKPSRTDRERVRHHFVDELSLGEKYSAGKFARAAEDRIRSILQRDHVPLVVGGSTLYLYALQHGFADIPEVAPGIRPALQERLVAEGSEVLYKELQSVDPEGAASMDSSKSQRIVRALEVYYGTDKPLSHYFSNHRPPAFKFRTFVLNRNRNELYRRINLRADAMLNAGLLEEVSELLAQGINPDLNALQTIGYSEPIQYLLGEIDHGRMIHLIKRNSRRYGKRQLTWFRRFPEYIWLDATETSTASLARQIQRFLQPSRGRDF